MKPETYKKILHTAIFVLLFAFLTGCAASPDKLYSDGKVDYEKGNYEKAVDNFTQALTKKPDLIDAYYQRGLSYLKLGQTDKAKADFTTVIEKKPDFTFAYIKRGEILKDGNLIGDAMKDFEKALELSPKNSRALNFMGECQVKMLEPEKALELFKKSVESDPQYGDAFYNLARYYLEQDGNSQKALENFILADKKKPNNSEIKRQIGALFMRMGYFDKGEEFLNKAIELDPSNSGAILDKAEMEALYNGDYEKAIEEVNKVIAKDPKNADAFMVRADYTLSGWNDNKKALEDIAKALELNPNLPDAYYLRGIINLQILKQNDKAVEDFSKAIDLMPRNPKALYGRYQAKLKLGKNKEAEEDLKKAKEYEPDIASTGTLQLITGKDGKDPARKYFNRGLAYLKQKNFNKSLEEFNNFIETSPKIPDGYYFRASAYMLGEKYPEAVQDLSLLIKANPKLTGAYLMRANALFELKKYREALADFNSVLKLQPDNIDALLGRGNLYALGAENYDAALKDFYKALDKEPGAVQAYFFIGKCQIKMGNRKEAMEALQKFVDAAPEVLQEQKESAKKDLEILSQEK